MITQLNGDSKYLATKYKHMWLTIIKTVGNFIFQLNLGFKLQF